jgi:FG-GAP-like repeat
MQRIRVAAVLLFSLSVFAADVQLRSHPLDASRTITDVGDFNGDGLDDIVGLRQLQFNLGGHFGPPVDIRQVTVRDGVTAVANFNGDAFADLVVYRERTPDLVLLGDGFGGFTAKAVSEEYGDVVTAFDFTGDGRGDLVQWKPGQVTLQRGRGDGSFVHLQTFPWTWPQYWNRPILTADVNSDGRPDLLMTNERGLVFFIAQADGTFVMRERFTRFGPQLMETGDLNGDGHLDIGFLSLADDQVAISALYGDGTGRFPGYTRTILPQGSRSIAIGDFVDGGALELAYGTADGFVVIFSGMGGQVREVARVHVDAEHLDVQTMRVRSATPELVTHGHVRYNTNRFAFVVDADGALEARPRGRTRAIQRIGATVSPGTYRLDLDSDCPLIGLTELTFDREGLFVDVATSGVIQAASGASLPDKLYLEIHVKDGAGTRVLAGDLVPTPEGTLKGKLNEWQRTPCGRLWGSHKVTAVAIR